MNGRGINSAEKHFDQLKNRSFFDEDSGFLQNVFCYVYCLVMVPKHALQLFSFPENSLKCAQTFQIMLFKSSRPFCKLLDRFPIP